MTSLNGQLLVASARLTDSFFHQTIILILAHSDAGAAGLILNRPTEATVSDLSDSIFQGSFEWDKPISLGGPVSGPLVILHQEPELADHEVLPGIYSTVEDSKARQVLGQRTEPSIVAINYSGWGPGQLERELSEESWEVLPAVPELIFPPAKLNVWREARRQAQALKLQELLALRGMPADPGWN